VVDELTARGEFYTAYTPYQPEASQGSLQAFFEFQSLICQLTGMEVANASLYEGGTAVSEAVFMAMRVNNRSRIVLLGSVHPQYREVVETYTRHLECEIVTVPAPGGTADPDAVRAALNGETACLVMQQPNYFGCLEEAAELVQAAHAVGALAIVSVNPISLGLLVRPGHYGADLVVAEGQPLGIPLQYGGPYLGVFACRAEHVRKMPGRLVGEAKDRRGNRCFVLSLQTREQHIRRDKATSNICTNQGLLALRATVYLSLLGPHGLREVATLCSQKAHDAAETLTAQTGVELAFNRPFFHEFTLRCPEGAASWRNRAAQAGFDVGPEVDADRLLVAVTEQRTGEEIDRLAAAMA
jgi:glycine dehydrogenase subunit 1